MRSRFLVAATATLAGAFLAHESAWAQEKPVYIPMAAAATSHSLKLLKSGHDGQVLNIGMLSIASALLPTSADLVPPTAVFPASGSRYAEAQSPSFGLDTAPARDFAASGTIFPGFEVDVARWQRSAATMQWETRSPYAGLATEGYFVGATLALSESLRLRAGRSISSAAPILEGYSPLPQNLAASLTVAERSTVVTSAGVDWSFADWGGVGVTATQTQEIGTVLGISNAGAAADTAAVGISARVGFGDGWVTTMSYSEGVTQLDLSRAGLLGQLDPVRTQAYGLSIAKHGLFGDDVLGIAVTRPMQLIGTDFAAAIGKDTARILPNAAPESDIEVGYLTTFLDGALALQANAAYQLNANGDKGQDAVSVLSRAKVRF
jgi:hypothetical protein